MKKIMFALAATAAVGAFAIESANTVGYSTLDFMQRSDFYMMGSQFETASGSAMKLSDIDFGDLSGAPYYSELFDEDGFVVGSAPEVRVAYVNQGGFKTYYYIRDGKPTEVEDVYEPGWVDDLGEYADPDMTVGYGFWFCNPSANAPILTTAGGVPDDPFIERTFNNDYRVLVNPYPVAATLSTIDFDGIDAAASTYSELFDEDGFVVGTAPEIRVPYVSQGGFKTYYYISDGKPTEVEDVYEPGWVDDLGEYADPAIPVGRGCWFKPNATSMTVTFYR